MVRLTSVLAALVAGWLALASPFVGARMEWGWPGLAFGYDFGMGQGYLVKYTPELKGWWALGFTGYMDVPYFKNFQFGGGARISTYFNDAWKLSAWHWGFNLEASWKYEATRFFVGLYTYLASNGGAGGSGSGPTPATWPFAGNTGLYVGFNVSLWELAKLAGLVEK